MAKIHAVILKRNTDIEFKKKKCELNKIKMPWGIVKFETKHIFGRTRTLPLFHLPLYGLKKAYIVVREGDAEPLTIGELPQITQKDIEEFAKSKLLKTLGLEGPRETSLVAIITLLLLFGCFILEILVLSGVRL